MSGTRLIDLAGEAERAHFQGDHIGARSAVCLECAALPPEQPALPSLWLEEFPQGIRLSVGSKRTWMATGDLVLAMRSLDRVVGATLRWERCGPATWLCRGQAREV